MTTEVEDNQVNDQVVRVGDTLVKSLAASATLQLVDDGEGNVTVNAGELVLQVGNVPLFKPDIEGGSFKQGIGTWGDVDLYVDAVQSSYKGRDAVFFNDNLDKVESIWTNFTTPQDFSIAVGWCPLTALSGNTTAPIIGLAQHAGSGVKTFNNTISVQAKDGKIQLVVDNILVAHKNYVVDEWNDIVVHVADDTITMEGATTFVTPSIPAAVYSAPMSISTQARASITAINGGSLYFDFPQVYYSNIEMYQEGTSFVSYNNPVV
jgi:hypothetical protein